MRNPFRKRRKKKKPDSHRQPLTPEQQSAKNEDFLRHFGPDLSDWKDADKPRPENPTLNDYSSEVLSLNDASEDVLWESDDGQYQSNEEPTFKKHKLDCDSCGSPLSLLGGQLAVCDFCHAQYYLEGFDPDAQLKLPQTNDRYIHKHSANPYWIDGGVSVRRITSKYDECS